MLLSLGSSRDGKLEGERSRKWHSPRQRRPTPRIFHRHDERWRDFSLFTSSFSVRNRLEMDENSRSHTDQTDSLGSNSGFWSGVWLLLLLWLDGSS